MYSNLEEYMYSHIIFICKKIKFLYHLRYKPNILTKWKLYSTFKNKRFVIGKSFINA